MTNTRSYNTAITQQNDGGVVSPYISGKNFLINGAMDFFQRGTTLSPAGGAFNPLADRWGTGRAGSAGAYTITRQPTGDTTNLPNIQYCLRIARNNGDTITGGMQTVQNMETANSLPLVGKIVTLSAYIRQGTSYSGGIVTLALNSGTGTDQNLNQSYTGNANVCTKNITPTTSWVRYSVTGTVASTTTELAAYFYQYASGTASNANDYIEVTGVQLEIGPNPTQFSRAGGNVATEFMLCKRYCQNINYSLSGKSNYNLVSFGRGKSSGLAEMVVPLSVPMRIAPTSVTYSGSFVLDNITGAPGVTGITLNQSGTDMILLNVTVASGLTAHQWCIIYPNSDAAANLIFSSEL